MECTQSSPVGPTPIYRNASVPIPDRTEVLLEHMNLEEKVAQLTSTCLRGSAAAKEGLVELDLPLQEKLRDGIGQLANTFDRCSPEETVRLVNALQRFLVEETRLAALR